MDQRHVGSQSLRTRENPSTPGGPKQKRVKRGQTGLPDLILRRVFEYVPIIERPALEMVSHQFVSAMPYIELRVLRLGTRGGMIPWKVLEFFLLHRLEKLVNLSGLRFVNTSLTPAMMRLIFLKLPDVRMLRFYDCVFLDNAITLLPWFEHLEDIHVCNQTLGSEAIQKALAETVQMNGNLRSLKTTFTKSTPNTPSTEFRSGNLEKIYLKSAHFLTNFSFKNSLESLPHLKDLTYDSVCGQVSEFSCVTKLQLLEGLHLKFCIVRNADFAAICSTHTKLRRLTVHPFMRGVTPTNALCLEPLRNLTNLEELTIGGDVRNVDGFSILHEMTASGQLSNLTKLHVETGFAVFDNLGVGGSPQWFLDVLARHEPHLNDVMIWFQGGEVSLTRQFKVWTNLKKLVLNNVCLAHPSDLAFAPKKLKYACFLGSAVESALCNFSPMGVAASLRNAGAQRRANRLIVCCHEKAHRQRASGSPEIIRNLLESHNIQVVYGLARATVAYERKFVFYPEGFEKQENQIIS